MTSDRKNRHSTNGAPSPDEPTSELTGIRINRFFTEFSVMSRRAADKAIANGEVTINGVVAKLGDRVQPEDEVMYDGKVIRTDNKQPVIIAYNKPVGIECTSDPEVPENIIDAVGYPERIFHIGRLDKMSEGLILLTNIGDIVNKILRSRFEHEKEYVVYLNGDISDEQIDLLRGGIEIETGRTKPCKVKRVNRKCIIMILTEGKNRQIRRMIDAIDLHVNRLKRIRVMNIELGDLPKDHWRELTDKEIKTMMRQISE